MKRVIPACLVVAWLGMAWWGRAQAPGGGEALALTLEDAIARALEHNRDLVKGALDLQGRRLRAWVTAGSAGVPVGASGTGSDGGWRAGLGAEAREPMARGRQASARQIDRRGGPAQSGCGRTAAAAAFGPLVRQTS